MSASSDTLAFILKGGSIFAMLTGCAGALFGIDLIVKRPADIAPPPKFPLVDSQYRYFASNWAGTGVILWWCSNDVAGRQTPLLLLSAVMFFGGVARALSAVKHGFSSNWIKLATAVEFVGPAMLYLLVT